MPKLGQHILVDKRVIDRLCSYAKVSEEDIVLEVGCGSGNITEFLLDRSQRVIGIELDNRYVKNLEERFHNEIASERLVLIHGDALQVDFPQFNKFVANIPFNISSPLTFKLLQHSFDLGAVIYQGEFASRMVAGVNSKDYGRLSVTVRSYCHAELMEWVPRGAFKPHPEVKSAIVRLLPQPQVVVSNRETFEDIVKFVFSQKRKMVGKTLSEWSKMRETELRIPEELRKKRPQDIGPEVYAQLADQAGKGGLYD